MCSKCEYSTTNSSVFCISCKGQLTGEDEKWTCESTTTVDGCSWTAIGADKKAYCSSCDGDNRWFENGTGTSPAVKCTQCKDTESWNNTTKKCVECDLADNYWKDGTTCTARVNKDISGCKTYFTTEDGCSECNSGMDNYDDSKKCGDLPDNCESLTSSETTIKCRDCNVEGYYNDDGACKAADVIAECQYWSGKDTCSQCKSGWTVKDDNKSCFEEKVADCKEMKASDDTKCDTCKDEYNGENNSRSLNRSTNTTEDKCVDRTSCETTQFKATGEEYDCITCSTSYSYWATDVIGTSKITGTGSNTDFWAQECTKSKTIASIGLAAVVFFAYL